MKTELPIIKTEPSIAPNVFINVQEQFNGLNEKLNAVQKELAQARKNEEQHRQNEIALEKRVSLLEAALKSVPGADFSKETPESAATWVTDDSTIS